MRRKFKRYVYKKAIVDSWIDEYSYSLAQTQLASMRGIAESCDFYPAFDEHDDYREFSSGEEISSIFVRHVDVEAFLLALEQYATRGFSLNTVVFGNTTFSADQKWVGSFQRTIERFGICNVYTTNLCGNSEAFEAIPIGLDYHSNFFKRDYFQRNRRLPCSQEAELLSIAKSANRFDKRYSSVSIDWGLTNAEREEAWGELRFVKTMKTDERVDRREVWEQHAKCQFVASPSGYGFDCHRIWEALALGCAVIVKSSPIDQLFAGLPVIIVSDWSEVTNRTLEEYAEKVASSKYDYRVCVADYWRKVIGLGQNPPAYSLPICPGHIFAEMA